MGTRVRSERTKRITTCLSLTIGGLALSTSGSGVGAFPTVQFQQADEVVPVESDVASVGDVVGENPTVSGDGRFVVFQGAPRDEADTRESTIYLTDRESGETIELSPVPAGLRSGDSMFPVISGDGCSVVAVTQMSLDVFRDNDTGGRWDVYRSTLPQCDGIVGDWELVSTRPDSGGIARDDASIAPPTLSRGGNLIAYTHPADHLFDADGITAISLVDIAVPVQDPARTRFVAGSPADSPTDTFTHRGLDQPALSGDGRFLAYRSDATSSEAVPGWAPGLVESGPATRQIYTWQLDQPDPFLAVQLVSVAPDGTPAAQGASDPDISRDGTSVAFTSTSTNLFPATYPICTSDCPAQVFSVDRDSDQDGEIGPSDVADLRLLSVENGSDPAVAGTAPSTDPSISADGELVAFVTKASNLQEIQVTAVGGGDDGDLLLAEVRNRRLSRLTNAAGGVLPTPGVHAHPDLSESGRTAVFDSAAAGDLMVGAEPRGRQIVARSSDPLLSLAVADVGTTLVGVESDEWYVAVVNDGPSSFRPTAVSISNSQFAIDEGESSCLYGSSVPAGGTCTVQVSFTPSKPGSATATLTVAEEGFDAVSVSSEIRGAGGEPALRVFYSGNDFGVVTVGETSVEYELDLGNVSFSPTEVTSFEITGEHASEFALASNNCAFRVLNPRAWCSIGVTFTPADAGRRTAVVELATKSGQYTTMVIAGDGAYQPVVELDTRSVQAGEDFVAVGTKYPPNVEVTVVFGDGPNSSVSTTTDAVGNFTVTVPVDPHERGGERRVVVQTKSGASASTPVEVVEDNDSAYVGMPGFGLG